mmetsp:Transcript_5816/g.6509  ORF Transcript_5816/g.6509 Transcript_5816/m.6509 type:complete len:126 (-) Transcript_5816:11-388(-)
MYSQLHKEDPEDTGLLVNAVAAHVAGEQSRKAMAIVSRNQEALESSYELCFNAACALIDEGRLQEAEAQLARAKDLCLEELVQAEDAAEADASLLEDHEELAAINVQQACVLQRCGKEDEAKELY